MNNFEDVFAQWLKTRFTRDPRTQAQIRVYAEGILEDEGGYVSLATFEKAYRMLVAEGEIQPFHGPAPEPKVAEQLDAEAYRRIPAQETARRYQTDLNFRYAVDKLIAEGKI